MSEFNFSLMKKLSELAGAPGFEDHVRAFIQSELKDVVDEFRTDQMGNLYAIRKGESSEKKVMSAAHMDEIGFIVRHVDKSGFIRFQTLGGFDPKTLTAQRVFVHGKKDLVGVMGCKPIHVMSPEERAKPAKIDDYFIDLGMPAEQVHELVTIGDPITRERELIEMGDCVNGKSLDNRVACFLWMRPCGGIATKNAPHPLPSLS